MMGLCSALCLFIMIVMMLAPFPALMLISDEDGLTALSLSTSKHKLQIGGQLPTHKYRRWRGIVIQCKLILLYHAAHSLHQTPTT